MRGGRRSRSHCLAPGRPLRKSSQARCRSAEQLGQRLADNRATRAAFSKSTDCSWSSCIPMAAGRHCRRSSRQRRHRDRRRHRRRCRRLRERRAGAHYPAGTTGAGDLYWYVPPASPLKSLSDLNGRTVAYSTNGASTHLTLLALIKHFNVTAKPVSTGAAALTLTQAMSGQIDVGWASPPFGLDMLEEGEFVSLPAAATRRPRAIRRCASIS